MKILENRMFIFIATAGTFAGCGSKPSASDPDAQVEMEMEMETRPDMALPPPDMGAPTPDMALLPPDMGIPSDAYIPSCGNGVRDPDEACDEGEANADEPDTCREMCELPYCGDAIADSDEECDDGFLNSNTAPDACREDCVVAFCGDSVIDEGEECDSGEGNSDTEPDACRTDCLEPSCGDGVVDSTEQCDDGADNSNVRPGACRATCVLPSCGDRVLDPDEQCEGAALQPCTPACGSAGIQNCEECGWGACEVLDAICDDEDPCTVSDHCEGEVCAADPVVCDDVVACTVDTCDSATGCVFAPDDSVCNDDNLCTDDVCDGADGCVNTPNTVACDDGNACTTDDVCADSVCAGTAVVCNDGDICTDDSCDPASGCVFANNAAVCDDSDPCTVSDTCADGACSGAPMVCNTRPPAECLPDVLTRRAYAASGTCAGGVCSYAATDTVCNDADVCTTDGCAGRACVFTAVVCDDAVACTVNSCNGASGCVFTPDDAVCNDGNFCTDDSCNSATGCVNSPNTLACDDANACTVVDTCSDGSCAGTPVVCESPPPTECLPDGVTRRTYAATGSCAGGVCSYAATDTVCDDMDACTNDGCTDGACTATPVVCDDAVACTDNSCNSATGCLFTDNTAACDDRDVCTVTDTCADGTCIGTPMVCNTPPPAECLADGLTRRTYDATGTCTDGVCLYNATDTVCDDADACTSDACEGGVCITAPTPGMPTDRICGDEIDNDCDGVVDDPVTPTMVYTLEGTGCISYAMDQGTATYGLVYGRPCSGTSEGIIRFVPIDLSALPAGPATIVESSVRPNVGGVGLSRGGVATVWNDSDYSVMWAHNVGSPIWGDLYFARVDSAGVIVVSPSVISTSRLYDAAPFPTWTGSEHGLAWLAEGPGGAGLLALYFGILSSSGTLTAGPTVIADSRVSWNQPGRPRVAWNGAEFGLSWIGGAFLLDLTSDANFSIIGINAMPLIAAIENPVRYSDTSVQWTDGSFHIFHADDCIYKTDIDPAGTVGTTETVDCERYVYELRSAISPRGFGVAWTDSVSGPLFSLRFVEIGIDGSLQSAVTTLRSESSVATLLGLFWNSFNISYDLFYSAGGEITMLQNLLCE